MLWRASGLSSLQEYLESSLGVRQSLFPTVLGLKLAEDLDLGRRYVITWLYHFPAHYASPPLCFLTCTLLNLYLRQVAHPAGVYPGFHCMKWLGVLIFSTGWNACPPSGFPDLPPVSSLGWRETLWEKRACLRTQHNDPCRSRTQTSRPEYSTLTIRPPRPPPCAQLFSICLFVCFFFFFFFPSIYLLILLTGTSLSH